MDTMIEKLPQHMLSSVEAVDNVASSLRLPISTKTWGGIVHVLAEARDTDRYCAVFDDPYVALITSRQDQENSVFVHSLAGPNKDVNSFNMENVEGFKDFMKKYFMKLYLIREEQ